MKYVWYAIYLTVWFNLTAGIIWTMCHYFPPAPYSNLITLLNPTYYDCVLFAAFVYAIATNKSPDDFK